VSDSFERAAELIVGTLEEEFGLSSPEGHELTTKAVVNILNHFTIPKTPGQVKACGCFACVQWKASSN
jgi:hypothetical protein